MSSLICWVAVAIERIVISVQKFHCSVISKPYQTVWLGTAYSGYLNVISNFSSL